MTDHAKLRKLAEAATPGPYHVNPTEFGEYAVCVYRDRHDGYASHLVANRLTGEDAEFVAAATPDVVLALLNEIDKLRSGRA